MKKITLICLIALCFTSFSCKKTASVYGIVSDSETHQPIEGVTVTLSSTIDWVKTESDGYFEFNDIELGGMWTEPIHIISAIHMDYKTQEVKIDLSKKERKEVNIEMIKYKY